MRRGGLDSVRGIAIGMIVISHTMPISIAGATRAAGLSTTLIGLFGMYVMPVAVPAFYLVSLGLYFDKPDFRRRMTRLLQLFVFWVGLQYVLYAVLFRTAPPVDFLTATKGGPSLTGYASYPTVFWFLFDLIVLTLLAEVFRRLGTRSTQLTRSLSWVVIVVSVTCFVFAEAGGIHIDHWSLVNFLMYVPLAWIMRDTEWRLRSLLTAYAVLTVLEMALAWVRPDVTVLGVSGYARTAIPVGAAALVLWGRRAAPHPVLEWLGRYSLGIYALHDTLRILALRWLPAATLAVGPITITLTILAAVCAVTLTLLLTWLLARTPMRRFVT
jgi:peptidoglycan/LPS O-acetylase OafA/YrhL